MMSTSTSNSVAAASAAVSASRARRSVINKKLVLTLVAWTIALVMFFPIFWMLMTSLKK